MSSNSWLGGILDTANLPAKNRNTRRPSRSTAPVSLQGTRGVHNRNTAEIQQKYSRNIAEIQQKYSRNKAEIQQKHMRWQHLKKAIFSRLVKSTAFDCISRFTYLIEK
jgi:hypothetical protein